MSLDPMVIETQSPFAYVNNDPVNGTDPSGDFLATCIVKPNNPHISGTRGFRAVNVHVQVECNEVVTQLTVAVQMWKTGFLGFNHKVGPVQGQTRFGFKTEEFDDYSIPCKNTQTTVYFAIVTSTWGTAGDGNLMYPTAPPPAEAQGPNSLPLLCGT